MNIEKKDSNWTVRSLWVGAPLTELEWASLKSFVLAGAKVELFTDNYSRAVPAGVILRNYREVLPKTLPRYGRRAGEGYGSLAIAANLARARTLWLEGGWWVDTDMICLKSFKDIDCNIKFAYETSSGGPSNKGLINVAAIRLPPQHLIAKLLCRQITYPWLGNNWDPPLTRIKNFLKLADTMINPYNVPWGFSGGPTALTKIVEHLNLTHHALPTETFYPIPWESWKSILHLSNKDFWSLSENSYAIHLWAEMYRRSNVDKGSAIRNCQWARHLISDFPT